MRRLNTDGTKDNSFDLGMGFNNRIQALSIQADGKIIVGGFFSAYNGTTNVNRMARLNTAVTQYTVTTSANPGAGGSVTGGGTYNVGGNVTMTATPNAGYSFVKWTEGGATVSTANPFTFTIAADRTLEAVFETTTSINGTHESKITAVFPNPTNSVLYLEVKEKTDVKIVNLLGKLLLRRN